ncbi:MAG: UDP-N-acetylmuramoyl-L-alanyl-D-glutamate--2,6-diaminopimelate ligase [Saprospiraceae bacterium]|nr:UDP-N-acetylmuramoyl-L-alanyl-D-glutamate--2,6-diaminopimelate ligase [Saprospiraceae bacterium]
MQPLGYLIEQLDVLEVIGNDQIEVSNIAIDSRRISSGGLFVAIPGTSADGHTFIDNAIQNGATCVVCMRLPKQPDHQVTWVRVQDSARVAGKLAHRFYGSPTSKLQLVGVTGTNGKTTVVTLLHDLMSSLGIPVGLISTVECRSAQRIIPATHTTPDPVTLNALLQEMVSEGCTHAFMEVSSHALVQQRTSGLRFSGGIFTNLSHDHLDYHGDFKSYIAAKKLFFDGLGEDAFALVNADDPRSEIMVQNCAAKVSKYSLHKLADFKGKILGNHIEGLHLQVNGVEVMSKLVGTFNAYNLLAVYGAAVQLGFDPSEVLTHLSGLDPVTGRFDLTHNPARGVSAVVDYAHTPDALQKVLGTLRQLKDNRARLMVLIGCGGDRDKAKRPKMGDIAASLSDLAILTSDNPRSEDPEAILDDMMAGISEEHRRKVLRISDRREAIRAAVRMAQHGDIILIAGKGHETYQEINGKRFPFNDKELVHEALFEDI